MKTGLFSLLYNKPIEKKHVHPSAPILEPVNSIKWLVLVVHMISMIFTKLSQLYVITILNISMIFTKLSQLYVITILNIGKMFALLLYSKSANIFTFNINIILAKLTVNVNNILAKFT